MHLKKIQHEQKSGDGVSSPSWIPQAEELKPRSESTSGQERFSFVQNCPPHPLLPHPLHQTQRKSFLFFKRNHISFAVRSFTFFVMYWELDRPHNSDFSHFTACVNLHFFCSIKWLVHFKSTLNEFIKVSINWNARVRIDT